MSRIPLAWAIVTLLAVPRAAARELPVRSFTTLDGLADNVVNRIVSDSRGLIWVCTNGGISRFDGAQFQTFGVAEGLPHPIINDLLETPDGDFWLASNGSGVIRMRLPAAARRYEAFLVDRQPTANRVNRLFRTSDGTIWVGTDGGLFRMTIRADGRPDFARVSLRGTHPDEMVQVWSFAADRDGTLWVGTRFGLLRLLPDGRIVSYTVREGLETDHVLALFYDAEDDALWIGHQSGLAILKPPAARSYTAQDANRDRPLDDPAIVRAAAGGQPLQSGSVSLPRAPDEAKYFTTVRRGGRSTVGEILRSQSGVIRLVSTGAVFEFSAGRFATVDDPRLHDGLTYGAEDQEGNLWLGKRAVGVLRVARHGFITFRESDGVGPAISTIFENRAGALVAISQEWRVSRFDGERFHTVVANIPPLARGAGWGANLRAIEDHRGEWWFATGAGLVRFPAVGRIEDLSTAVPTMYTTREGLAQNSINRLFEDSRGDIWISSLIPGREVLTRWDRAANRFQTYSDADGLRAFNSPSGFFEDAHHVLFITLRDGGIARYDGVRFRILSEADGLPNGNIGGSMADIAGRLWIWAAPGVFRIDNVSAERLKPVMIATPSQARGGIIGSLAEDATGSLYIATGKGVARVDHAATAADRPRIAAFYTASDGLATANEVPIAYADRAGRLWFGTTQGLSYYEPEVRRVQAPQVRIGGLRIAGVDQPVSPAGDDRLDGLELSPGRSQLEIAFFGISFTPGNTLSFEYRLLGAGNDWSAPSPLRSVMFSNLAPGSYTFEVRAVSAGGDRSPQPARAAFRVQPPVWRRWWFLSILGLAALGGVTAFERYRAETRREISRAREQRLIELEQVRRRIAADLHDEIGSSLTQISILSEVAQQQGSQAVPELNHPLSMIAASSRELVDAMSDIVWAINPAKDHLADLTQRMRRLAADAFTATGTTFHLQLPAADREIPLGANLRREVFLIFKEAVNNVVKHSACTEAAIALTIEGSLLRLDVRDNGKGFDTRAPADGHGLASLRARAASLGGTFEVVSAPGAGTAITLSLPVPT